MNTLSINSLSLPLPTVIIIAKDSTGLLSVIPIMHALPGFAGHVCPRSFSGQNKLGAF